MDNLQAVLTELGLTVVTLPEIQTVTVECILCGTPRSVTVNGDDWHRYLCGDLVQDIWPDMDADDREVLIGGRTRRGRLCSDCWGEE